MQVVDPLALAELCWPHVTFYKEQREIIYSVRDNHETYVPAGNMLGKDFVAAFIALWFFLSRAPCRVVTTSVDHTQLEGVLWGEIRRFLQTSEYPLATEQGGPLLVNHLHLRKIIKGQMDGLSYLIGRVAAKGEGMLGHHIAKTGDGVPRTLFIADEASGVDDVSYERADTWADRKLVIGNPYPCNNFFYKGVKAGDKRTVDNLTYRSKVIRIKAEASPNVRLALKQLARDEAFTGEMLVPGVLPYAEYLERRANWDKVRQSIGLDAEFYEGAEVLLYPPDWLNRAEARARELAGSKRNARTLGIDSAAGGDKTAYAVCDEFGLIYLEALRTPDTSVITARTLALMREYNVQAGNVLFDAGGGGKQHADRLRLQGHNVRTVAFGESASPELKHGMTTLEQRKRQTEVRYVYKNRRAEMYGLLRERLDPASGKGFSLPAEYTELRRQLSPLPLLYDEEGRLYLPPKARRDENQTKQTLTDLLGCSPDEADALVLAVFGLTPRAVRQQAGVVRV
jgi:hypothetical protein